MSHLLSVDGVRARILARVHGLVRVVGDEAETAGPDGVNSDDIFSMINYGRSCIKN